MKMLYLSLPGGLHAQIASSKDIKMDKTSILLFSAYIPGLKIMKNKPKKTDISIKHIESEKMRMIQKENHVTLYGRWKNHLPLDVYHLLYSMLRVELLRKGLYAVHAACAGNCLIAGHTGAGKTAITLALVKEGMKVFSGNKTVVSFSHNLHSVAGTPTITLRSAEKPASHIGESAVYGDRLAFSLAQENYAFSPVKIKKIFIARLNDGAREFTRLSPVSAMHKLYPYFMDAANADTIMCNGNCVFAGKLPAGVEARLAKSLSAMLKKIPAYSVSGSKPFVIKRIMGK
jgi:hypothetical protein